MNVVTPHDVPWTGTGGPSDKQSYSWLLLNAIYNRLIGTSLFSGFACRRIHSALPIEAGVQIPFLGIYGGPEILSPDGDANVGEIRFIHSFPIGFQIVIKNNDPVAMLAKLDELSWFIMNQLLRDDSLTNMYGANLTNMYVQPEPERDNARFEAVTSGSIQDRWGLTGSKNETPVGERQLNLQLRYRTLWYPTEFPDLHRITVRTAWPPGSTSDEQLQVQQVTMVYDFNPDSVPYPLPDDTDPPPNPFP